jgi:hypothetical protein
MDFDEENLGRFPFNIMFRKMRDKTKASQNKLIEG